MAATDRLSADAEGIAQAARLLQAGDLVSFPTETVYGLGAVATDDHAVARIFAAKGRPTFNPLIVHVASSEAAKEFAEFPRIADDLARAFWPGPLTLVVKLKETAGISALVTAGLNTVAVRVPDHASAQSLLRAVERPIAAPSANPSGRISPTNADHVLDGLRGRIAAVLDDGPCGVGLESTIVDATASPRLLRPGGLPQEAIEAVTGPLGPPLDQAAGGAAHKPNAPGQLESHYAPVAQVRMNATSATGDEVLLGFGGTPGADLDLSPAGDTVQAAANLFGMLHQLDSLRRPIAVAPVPESGLGRAINDRLRRAAAPRN